MLVSSDNIATIPSDKGRVSQTMLQVKPEFMNTISDKMSTNYHSVFITVKCKQGDQWQNWMPIISQ